MALPDPRTLPYTLLRLFPLSPALYWIASRLTNDLFLIGCAGIVRDDAGRLLVFHHTYRRKPWGLPGGWMMRGESPLAAVEREVREETGLDVHSERLALVGVTRDRAKLEMIVLARLIGGEFRPSREVSRIAWIADSELGLLPSVQRRIVADCGRLAPGRTEYFDDPWHVDEPAERS